MGYLLVGGGDSLKAQRGEPEATISLAFPQSTFELDHSKKGTSLSTCLPCLDASLPLRARAASAPRARKSSKAAAAIPAAANALTSRRGEERRECWEETVRALSLRLQPSGRLRYPHGLVGLFLWGG